MVNNVHILESDRSKQLACSNAQAINAQVSRKLISLTDDAYCTVRLFQGIFIHQPILVAAVLRLANASNLKSPVLTLSEAISMLGWKKIRAIISSICLQAANNIPNGILFEVWQQCALRTIIANLLSNDHTKDVKQQVESCCYVLGLGKFQLATQEPEKYREVIELVKAGCNLFEAEQAKFSDISVNLSVKMCLKNKLPEYFSDLLERYSTAKSKDIAFEVLSQAEMISIAMLYQKSELENIKEKFEINNFDKIIKTANRELELLFKTSGF